MILDHSGITKSVEKLFESSNAFIEIWLATWGLSIRYLIWEAIFCTSLFFTSNEFFPCFKIKGMPDDLKTTVNPVKTLAPRFITRAVEAAKKRGTKEQ